MLKKGWKIVFDGVITLLVCGFIGWVIISVLPNFYMEIENHIYELSLGMMAVSAIEQALLFVLGVAGVIVCISAIVVGFLGNNIVWWIWIWAKNSYALARPNRDCRKEVDNSLWE